MSQPPVFAWLVAIVVWGTACDSKQRQTTPGLDSTELAARAARFEQALAHPDSDSEAPLARWLLPPALDEISGLAITADGRLLAHGDQRAEVFEIDYRRGTVVKQFSLGKPTVHADFEGITMIGDTVVLLASDGTLYMFREGANGARVDYAMHDTKLGRECEFEGVAFDSALRALLLACKNVRIKSLKDALVIFRWKLDGGKGPQLSRLTVPLNRISGSTGWDGLHPSDITIDPLNGNYLIVASREEGLVEITPTGSVIFARGLPGDHYQAEGVAITQDSILIVSDEKSLGASEEHKHRGIKDETGVITLYRWPLARAPRETP
jgi:uncharacterized protein YjiK